MEKPVALVTGASRGIGRGIAMAMAASGHDIAIAYLESKEKLRESVTACRAQGAKVLPVQGDVGSRQGRESIIAAVREGFGRLDVLVNNAGVAPKVRADLLEATEESFDRLIAINLKGPYFLSQLTARWMIEEKKADPSRKPMIINISSISAYTSSTMRGDYCVSKAGISMMTKLFADRLAEYDIPVYEIRPGIIMTDMTSGVKDKYDKLISEGLLPLKRWGTPSDVGKAAAALASGAFAYSTGQTFDVDGGFELRRL